MVKSEILKEKAKRIVKSDDKARLEFLSIVASHNGSIMSDSVFTSFKRFREKYGEEKFEEIKNELVDEGIVVTSYGGIQLAIKNEKGDYDYQKGEELSRFIGKLIFEHTTQMREAIDKIFEEPEGKEFLKYISKNNGIHTSDGEEPEIKKTIGKRSYEEILEHLLKAGILTEYAWSSKKHGYHGYKILPSVETHLKGKLSPLELLTMEEELKEKGVSSAEIYRSLEILGKIYVGQNIRSEGILQSDFSGYKKETEILTQYRFIKDNFWYSFHLYVTTEKGSCAGKLAIEALIKNKGTKLTDFILSLPRNLVRFLLFDYMAPSLMYPVDKEYLHDWREPLLADSRIWILRNKLLSKLEETGLCIKTRSYVSTRGGELRREYYVTCEEVLNFLKDCTAYKGGLFEKEKKMCLLYDFLRKAKYFLRIENINEVRTRYYNEMEELKLTKEEIEETVNEMAKKGITSEYKGLLSDRLPFTIRDESRYDIYLQEQLIKPVVHFLLKGPEPKISIKAEKVVKKRLEKRKEKRKKFSRTVEKVIWDRYHHKCAICGRYTKFDDGEIDHKKPLAKGGTNRPSNLQWLCHRCNRLKGRKKTNYQVRKILGLERRPKREKRHHK